MSNVIPFPSVSKADIGGDPIDAVDLRELHAFLGPATSFDKWVSRRIEEYGFIEDSDFSTFLEKSSGGRPRREYVAAIDMAKELSMVEKSKKGKQARQYFINCEKAAKAARLALPQDFPEALRRLADITEKEEQARIERDEAIRTKAEIGGRREATAMNTARIERQRANKLQKQLGINSDWKQAKAITWIQEIFDTNIKAAWSQIGKKLTSISNELEQETKLVEDTSFGTVKAYHVTVIDELHKRLLDDQKMMIKYRKQEYAA